MWLWDESIKRIGFRRRSERYWRCDRGYGLSAADHLSLFSWSEQRVPPGRFLVEMTEFHVTFVRGGEHLHFYYHETNDNRWKPGGHTSGREIRRLGLDKRRLRRCADAIAAAVVAEMGGVLLDRWG